MYALASSGVVLGLRGSVLGICVAGAALAVCLEVAWQARHLGLSKGGDVRSGECMKYFMFLCYFTGFLASLAVGRFLYIRHLNRRFRGSRDNFDGIGLEETDASGGWMECHHAAYQLRGDPMVGDDQPPLDLENEQESHETMDEIATSPPDSSDLDVPHRAPSAVGYKVPAGEQRDAA